LARDFTRKEADEETSPLLLTDDEETVLVYVMVSTVHEGGLKPAARAKLNRELIDSVPKLLEKYSADFTSPGRICELITVIKNITLESYVELRMLPAFGELFESLSRVYVSYENNGVLKRIAETFEYFLQPEDGSDDGNPVYTNAKGHYNEFVAGLMASLCETLRVLKESEANVDLELYRPVVKVLSQVHTLAKSHADFFTIACVKSCEFEDAGGPYALMNVVLEHSLQVLKSDDSLEISIMCVRLVQHALELMKLETFGALARIVEDEEEPQENELEQLTVNIKR
jgi:hypothetical protein